MTCEFYLRRAKIFYLIFWQNKKEIWNFDQGINVESIALAQQ